MVITGTSSFWDTLVVMEFGLSLIIFLSYFRLNITALVDFSNKGLLSKAILLLKIVYLHQQGMCALH